MVGTIAAAGIVSLLTACGQTAKQSAGQGATAGNSVATVKYIERTPTKQEVAKARGCLKKEGVRPAKRVLGRNPSQVGGTGLVRYGLPVTRGEYAATVRRCTHPARQ